jgi:hypothetical protein
LHPALIPATHLQARPRGRVARLLGTLLPRFDEAAEEVRAWLEEVSLPCEPTTFEPRPSRSSRLELGPTWELVQAVLEEMASLYSALRSQHPELLSKDLAPQPWEGPLHPGVAGARVAGATAEEADADAQSQLVACLQALRHDLLAPWRTLRAAAELLGQSGVGPLPVGTTGLLERVDALIAGLEQGWEAEQWTVLVERATWVDGGLVLKELRDEYEAELRALDIDLCVGTLPPCWGQRRAVEALWQAVMEWLMIHGEALLASRWAVSGEQDGHGTRWWIAVKAPALGLASPVCGQAGLGARGRRLSERVAAIVRAHGGDLTWQGELGLGWELRLSFPSPERSALRAAS